MPNHNWLLQSRRGDYEIDVLQQLVHRVTIGERRHPWRLAGEPMAALVHRDQPALGEVPREPLPVASVRAEAMQQQRWRFMAGARLRRPLEVVQRYSISLEPAVGRGAHWRLTLARGGGDFLRRTLDRLSNLPLAALEQQCGERSQREHEDRQHQRLFERIDIATDEHVVSERG